jgi:RNA polymerase sigma factor (sigma-70 family)
VGGWDNAADAAQEAFAQAFRHIDELVDPQAFPAWFATLVRTACSRQTRKSRPLPVDPGTTAANTPDAAPAPDELAVARETRTRVRAAIEALPTGERAVIALHYLADVPMSAVGEFLGISEGAAKKRASRARKRLQELLPMMNTAALSCARPSTTSEFRDNVVFFAAIARCDHRTVKRMLERDPALCHATEDWSWDEAMASGLGPNERGTALLRAVATGDRELVSMLLDAGAHLDRACGCAGGEHALWTATVLGDRELVELLLDEGADPNASAFAGATPLHVAVQRDHHAIVRRLLQSGADPHAADGYGRTPADWAQIRRDAEPNATGGDLFPTGIRAIDLFAPLMRGSVQYWPPAVEQGQTVLLLAIADALSFAQCWFVGFAVGPYNERNAAHAVKEAGIAAHLRYAPPDLDAAGRRSVFAAALDEVAASPGEKLVICQSAPGHAHDVMIALPGLACDPNVLATIVVEPYVVAPEIKTRPPEGFTAQVAFDPARAKRQLWPAIDPRTTISRSYPSERHARLANGAREALTKYQQQDPDLALDGRDDIATRDFVTYFTQPFRLWEPFSSRPGERTPYDTLLDEVEAQVLARLSR